MQSSLGALRMVVDDDIKMVDVFAHAELGVERNGRRIGSVRLDENDLSSPISGNLLQMSDQAARDALSTMACRDCKVLDIDFAVRLRVFLEFVWRQRTDHRVILQGREQHKRIADEEIFEIVISGWASL